MVGYMLIIVTLGKLPVDIDNKSVPYFQEGINHNMASMDIEELPPPIPPKKVNWKENDATCRQPDDNDVKKEQFQAMQEPAAPALPPKPKK